MMNILKNNRFFDLFLNGAISAEMSHFMSQLASAKAPDVTSILPELKKVGLQI